MLWMRTKIVSGVTIGLVLCTVVVGTFSERTIGAEVSTTSAAAVPFTFADHALAKASGLESFTSNIPVVVLQSERPGAVSNSKNYSAFKMEIYEPGKDDSARLANAPTVTTRAGLRLHGMVSREFPKL